MSDAALTAKAPGAFSPRTVIALILVALFAFAGVMVLSAYAPDLQRGDNGGEHAMSKSAVGFAGAVKLLELTGQRVVLSRGPLSSGADDGLLILTPHAMHDDKSVAEVRQLGATLLVLPKWNTRRIPNRPSWVETNGPIPPAASLRPVTNTGSTLHRRTGVSRSTLYRPNGQAFGPAGAITGLQTISGKDWVPVLVDDQGHAVLAMHAKTQLYVLADPDLLNTMGMADPARARTSLAMLRLIWKGDGPVIFDLTLHGLTRTRNLLKLMLEPPLLGATLCLLIAATLVGFQAAVRFGPRREAGRAIALGKLALADNTAGLVRLAKREHRMASPYAQMVRAWVARAVAAPRNLDGEQLDAFLDRLGARLGVSKSWTALDAEARSVRTPADLIRSARNLYRWRLEMTRGHP